MADMAQLNNTSASTVSSPVSASFRNAVEEIYKNKGFTKNNWFSFFKINVIIEDSQEEKYTNYIYIGSYQPAKLPSELNEMGGLKYFQFDN